MATRNAIIRRLPGGNLGSVTVVCWDKTGTLTRNEMTVQRVVTADQIFEVSGVGYAPIGGFSVEGKPIMPEDADLLAIARAVRLVQRRQSARARGRMAHGRRPHRGRAVGPGTEIRPRPMAEQARFRRLTAFPSSPNTVSWPPCTTIITASM